MNRKKIETYQMLTQVADFARQHVGLFPENSAAAEILEALESGVKGLSDEASTIVSAETALRVGRSNRVEFREKLKTALVQACQIAEALNADILRIPAKRKDQALIDSGHALVVDAQPMKNEFERHGLPLETVRATVEGLEQAILSCTNAKAMRSAAVEKWDAALDKTLRTVKRYDPLVAITLEDNPGAIASYAVARAIPRTGGRKAVAGETPPAAESAPAPVPAPVPLASAAVA